MKKHWYGRRLLAAAVFVCISVPLMVVQACGPDFPPDVFIAPTQAANPVEYAKGRLGVLQPGYWIAEKVVAFRYLNGGTLDAQEQAQWLGVEDPNGSDAKTMRLQTAPQPQADSPQPVDTNGATRWLAAHGTFGAVEPSPISQEMVLHRKGGDAFMDVTVLNCPDAALDTAVATLADRAKRWGASSASLKEWLAGQDAVFSNCPAQGSMPSAPAADAPELLRQDRAYQRAAALFYAGRYPESRDAFLAIGQDKASPWSRWGGYLAGRALVRQAALANLPVAADWGDLAVFDKPLLQQAAEALTQAEQHAADAQVRHAAHAELNFVQVRLAPQQQTEKMATILGSPARDPDFGQHLIDLRFLLDHHGEGDAPMLDWMRRTGTTFRQPAWEHPGAAPAIAPASLPQNALAAWQQHRDTPSLIAALMDARLTNTELAKAAADIPENSPSYVTAQYHRARLMLPEDPAGARTLTTHVLELTQRLNEISASNGLRMLRMHTATNLADLLHDAPREMITDESSSATLALCADHVNRFATEKDPCRAPVPDLQFDTDAAVVFNTRLPLSLWVQASRDNALPQHLRAQVARAAWLRALILNDGATAKFLVPLLPDNIRSVLSKSPDPNGFAATLVLLHAPGFRPNLDQGVQRSASYAIKDDYRDNWWCTGPREAVPDSASPLLPVGEPVFLTAEQKAQAAQQVAVLSAHLTGVAWIGQRAIDYVKAHPDEPVAAQSLALVVRASHFGCSPLSRDGKDPASVAQTAVSKEAFDLLHTRYPKSEWAIQTKYYY